MASQYIKFPFFSLWGDPVDTALDLPANGREGEVRLVIDEGSLYWFNGATWETLTSGGGGGSITIQTDLGTSPVGTNFTFTSTNSLDITGNSTTDTVLFEIKTSYIRSLFSGAAGISYNSTTGEISISISGLTEDTNPDYSADFVMTYDASATANKKVKLQNINGGYFNYDEVQVALSSGNTVETYTYKLASSTVKTKTLTYSDNTRTFLTSEVWS